MNPTTPIDPIIVMRILYGPYAYAHTDRRTIDGVDLARLPAGMANQRLIDHHRLDTHFDFAMPDGAAARRCVRYWAHLPRICFLMGLQCLRAALVQTPRHVHLDPLAQQFICLPVSFVPRFSSSDTPDDADILAAGAACLASVLQDFPRPFRQRFSLLFSREQAARMKALPSDGSAFPSSLFSFAVHYALLTPTARA